jgi:hypothetical protein
MAVNKPESTPLFFEFRWLEVSVSTRNSSSAAFFGTDEVGG